MLDRIFAWVEGRWDWLKCLIVKVLSNLFFSFRAISIQKPQNKIKYSVNQYFREQGSWVYHPANLVHLIIQDRKKEEEFNKGELYWSHTDRRIF